MPKLPGMPTIPGLSDVVHLLQQQTAALAALPETLKTLNKNVKSLASGVNQLIEAMAQMPADLASMRADVAHMSANTDRLIKLVDDAQSRLGELPGAALLARRRAKGGTTAP